MIVTLPLLIIGKVYTLVLKKKIIAHTPMDYF